MISPVLRRIAIAFAAAILVFAIAAVTTYQWNQPGTVSLRFEAVMGAEQLEFNAPIYANPGGDGQFRISSFQFYLSNIQLVGTGGTYTVPDSYHLARFDNPSANYELALEGIPRDSYSRIILSIGIDEKANKSIVPVGDLDPNNRMAWNWEVGYKFLLFEGVLLNGDRIQPLVYHVGFSENRKVLAFDLPDPVTPGSANAIAFSVNVMALFNGRNRIDMNALPSVKFDRDDARLLADNYATMISLGVLTPAVSP